MPLARATADTRVIIATTVQALEGMYRPGFNHAKAGVMLVELRPQGQPQGELDLFGMDGEQVAPAGRAPSRLMGAVDALDRRFGRGAITVTSAARQAGNGGHSGRQERRSPRVTTRLEEIVTARA